MQSCWETFHIFKAIACDRKTYAELFGYTCASLFVFLAMSLGFVVVPCIATRTDPEICLTTHEVVSVINVAFKAVWYLGIITPVSLFAILMPIYGDSICVRAPGPSENSQKRLSERDDRSF